MIIPKQIQQTIKCPKSIMETLEQDVKYVKVNNKDFFVIFEHTSHLVLVFLLLTLNMFCLLGCRKQVNPFLSSVV